MAFVSQGLEIHSSMSETFHKHFVKVIRLYLRGFLTNHDYKIKTLLAISYCIPVKPVRRRQSSFSLLKIIIKLPVQLVPSPVNPFLHSQVYEVIASLHTAFVWQGLEIQSSMSKNVT